MNRSLHKYLALAVAAALTACAQSSEPTTTAPTTTTVFQSTSTTQQATTTSSVPATTTTTAPTQGESVRVYFSVGDGSDCSLVKGFERVTPAGADPVLFAFEQLVIGPTDEEQATGAGAFFSAATEGTVQSAPVDDGFLIVDFADFRTDMNNASTSCGSEALLSQLQSTAFQFEQVDTVTFMINGSCSTFFNWLQRSCEVYER